MASSNRTEFAILGLLASGPKSGYDVKKAVESALRHFWSESFGQIYPVLRRLAARGLVGRRTEGTAGGRRRHVYALSDAGRAALAEWLTAPVERVPPRNELLLKLRFGEFARGQDVRQHVLRFREQEREALRELEAIRADLGRGPRPRPRPRPGPGDKYRLLTIDSGISSARAGIAWANATLSTLAGDDR